MSGTRDSGMGSQPHVERTRVALTPARRQHRALPMGGGTPCLCWLGSAPRGEVGRLLGWRGCLLRGREPVASPGPLTRWVSLPVLCREAISRVCEAVPGAKGAFRKRKVLSPGPRVRVCLHRLALPPCLSILTAHTRPGPSSPGLAVVTFKDTKSPDSPSGPRDGRGQLVMAAHPGQTPW